MDLKEAVLLYQYGEKIKSELIIASKMLASLSTFQAEEKLGGQKLMNSFLEALLGEIRIAQGSIKSEQLTEAEAMVTESIGRLKISESTEAHRCISRAISAVTTSLDRAARVLEENALF